MQIIYEINQKEVAFLFKNSTKKIIITEEHICQNITDWTDGETVLRGLSHRHTVQTVIHFIFHSCKKKNQISNAKSKNEDPKFLSSDPALIRN